jgi:hypothetical protein
LAGELMISSLVLSVINPGSSLTSSAKLNFSRIGEGTAFAPVKLIIDS